MPPKEKKYCYAYPHPAVTVDIVCLRSVGRTRHVLLIQRKNGPFQGSWALPGGFVDIGEDLESAARRELWEETGLRVRTLRQVGAFGKPGRDPRERTISIAFLARIGHNKNSKKIRAADDARDVKWFNVRGLPTLAFDHRRIIRQALESVKER
jgi:8-oxo-dGTP diphosphatase